MIIDGDIKQLLQIFNFYKSTEHTLICNSSLKQPLQTSDDQ
jgi:hypothetical protein